MSGLAAARERLDPVIAEISAGAVRRDRERALPFAEVGRLRDAGFGALRIPVGAGGDGLELDELVGVLIDLGAADSNLPQLLRGHIAFVETQLGRPDSAHRTVWLERLARDRVLVGNAQAELSGSTSTSTTIRRDGDRLVLDGRKFYSTGTLFADWVWTGGRLVESDEPVAVAVPTTASGVDRADDWNGFGQRLTGSGTTVFADVEIDEAEILPWAVNEEGRSLAYTQGLYQLVLLSALAGIARRAREDAVGFVRPRTRTFGVPGTSSPREDPLVQRVIGRLGALATAAEASTLHAARTLADADAARRGDDSDHERYYTALVTVFEAQQTVIEQTLQATTLLFEVGGASATDSDQALDRLWRNARTIASHNPAIHRERMLGDYYLNDELPVSALHRSRSTATQPA